MTDPDVIPRALIEYEINGEHAFYQAIADAGLVIVPRERIDNIFRRLSALYSPSEVEVWLKSPHPQLDNETALSAMIRGRANEVTAILDRLEGGAYL